VRGRLPKEALWRGVLGGVRGCLDWLLPPACQLCGETLAEASSVELCSRCRTGFPGITSPHCPVCLLPHATPTGLDYPCESCLRQPLPIQRVIALGLYADTLRQAVHAFKYRNRIGLQRPLGCLLAERVAAQMEAGRSPLLVPVPLHGTRLRQRTYNQSQLLAREMGRRLGCSVAPRLLKRVRATPSQQGLPLEERLCNVRGAFEVTRALQGDQVLLVDDVMTTGATARSCAAALLQAGAAVVELAVLARAPRPDTVDLFRGE